MQEVSTHRIQRTLWPAEVFGYMAIVLVRGNEFEKMLNVLNFLAESPDGAVGHVQRYILEELFEACISRGHFIGALVGL